MRIGRKIVEASATKPSWAMVADLTPREVGARKTKSRARKLCIVGLIIAILGSGGWYANTLHQHSEATSAAAAAQKATSGYAAELEPLAAVADVRDENEYLKGILAKALARDIDMGALDEAIRAAAPEGVTVTRTRIDLAGEQSSLSPQLKGVGNLEGDGTAQVGYMTISAFSNSSTGLPDYIQNLSELDGVLSPYPTSSSVTGSGTSFSLQVLLNGDLLTHPRTETGGN